MEKIYILQADRFYTWLLVHNTSYICISYYGLKCQKIRGRNSLVSNLPQLCQTPTSQQSLLYVKQRPE